LDIKAFRTLRLQGTWDEKRTGDQKEKKQKIS